MIAFKTEEGKKTLSELMQIYVEIENEIIDNGGEVTDEIEDKLASAESDVEEKVDNYEHFIRHLKGQIEYLKNQEKHYQTRRRTMENTIQKLRERLIYMLDYYKMPKLKTSTFNFKLGESHSWQIDSDKIDVAERERMIKNGYAEEVFKPHLSVIKADNKYTPEEELPEYIVITTKKTIRVS